jgi:hypothetical protein
MRETGKLLRDAWPTYSEWARIRETRWDGRDGRRMAHNPEVAGSILPPLSSSCRSEA